jgi:hypothetical protein
LIIEIEFQQTGGHAEMEDTKKGIAEQSEMGLSLEELIRRGARELIQKAIEVEVQELLAEYGNVKVLVGQRAVVRKPCDIAPRERRTASRAQPFSGWPSSWYRKRRNHGAASAP